MPTDSSLPHILGPHTIPSPIEAESMKQRLGVIERRVSAIEAELETLSEEAQHIRAALAPIRRVPLEILGEIIQLVVPDVLDHHGRGVLLNVGLVCRTWRNMSLAAPRLWSQLVVNTPASPSVADKVVSWFNHGGNVPRSLEFRLLRDKCLCEFQPRICFSPDSAEVRLLTGVPMLGHVSIVFSRSRCFRNCMDSIKSSQGVASPISWDALTSLTLYFIDSGFHWDEPTDPSQSTFRHLPQTLTALDLTMPFCGGAFPDRADAIDAPLHIPPTILQGLKSFTIFCDWFGPHIFNLLEHCTNVETLTVDTGFNELWGDVSLAPRLLMLSNEPIVLPKTHTLRLRDSGKATLLKYIQAPFLSHLDIDGRNKYPDDESLDPVDVDSFLTASGVDRSLVSLRICDVYVPGPELSYVVGSLWGLKRLTLDNVQSYDPANLWDDLRGWAQASASRGDRKSRSDIQSYLPNLAELNLLRLPADYPLHAVVKYLESIPEEEKVPCAVTVSFVEPHDHDNTESLFGSTTDGRLSFRTVPPPNVDMYFTDESPVSSE